MLFWEICGRDDRDNRRGWVVAWSHAEAYDIARHENATLIGKPIEWLPGHGSQVFWKMDIVESGTMH